MYDPTTSHDIRQKGFRQEFFLESLDYYYQASSTIIVILSSSLHQQFLSQMASIVKLLRSIGS